MIITSAREPKQYFWKKCVQLCVQTWLGQHGNASMLVDSLACYMWFEALIHIYVYVHIRKDNYPCSDGIFHLQQIMQTTVQTCKTNAKIQ